MATRATDQATTPTITSSLSPPAAELGEVLCARCGYRLRGLDGRGRCPECGHAIEDSVREWQTRHARWARPVRWGLAVFLINLIPALALPFLQPTSFGLGVAMTIGIWLTGAAAVWLMTTSPPPRPGDGGSGSSGDEGGAARSLRLAARWTTLVTATIPLCVVLGSRGAQVVVFWLTLPATLLLYIHLYCVARRRGARDAAALALVAGGTIVFALALLVDVYTPPFALNVRRYFRDESTLLALTGLGPPAAMKWGARRLVGNRSFRPRDWQFFILMAGVVLAIVTMIRLWFVVGVRPRQRPVAGAVGATGATIDSPG